MKAVYIIPAYNSGSRLGQVFRQTLLTIKAHLARHFRPSELLVVNNSSEENGDLTVGVAIRCRVRVISVDQVSVGYARCKGLKYAFGELEADCAFMGDDDLHTPPQGIPLLYAGIEKGNDLVIGHRSFRSFITHPPLQVILESGFNLAACTRALALPTDLISGSAAFSREGWMKIDPFLTEEVMRNVRTGVPFLLPVYKSLGLGVCSIPVPGPYEGSYFRDSLDLGYIRRRLRSIRADYIDVERGIRFAREISVRTQGA